MNIFRFFQLSAGVVCVSMSFGWFQLPQAFSEKFKLTKFKFAKTEHNETAYEVAVLCGLVCVSTE